MQLRILKKLILLLVIPAALIFAWLYATSTGTLAQQIPGTDAKGNANISCVYFFARGFKNDVMTTTTTCPATTTWEAINAETH